MHRILIMLGLIGIFIGTLFCLAKGAEKDQYKQGENLYNEKCQICHGKQGDGNGPGGVAFSPRPSNFTNPKFWQDNPDKKISDAIRKGKGMMPALEIKPDEIQAIIDYMSHIFKK